MLSSCQDLLSPTCWLHGWLFPSSPQTLQNSMGPPIITFSSSFLSLKKAFHFLYFPKLAPNAGHWLHCAGLPSLGRGKLLLSGRPCGSCSPPLSLWLLSEFVCQPPPHHLLPPQSSDLWPCPTVHPKWYFLSFPVISWPNAMTFPPFLTVPLSLWSIWPLMNHLLLSCV